MNTTEYVRSFDEWISRKSSSPREHGLRLARTLTPRTGLARRPSVTAAGLGALDTAKLLVGLGAVQPVATASLLDKRLEEA